MRTMQLTDEKGYSERREEIDALILGALATGGKTSSELCIVLRAAGIGDAASDEPLALAQSSTGAIQRAARNSLRIRNLIHDSWDFPARPYEKPFRYFAGGRRSRAAVGGL